MTVLYRRETVQLDDVRLPTLELPLGSVRTLLSSLLKALNEREYGTQTQKERGCYGC